MNVNRLFCAAHICDILGVNDYADKLIVCGGRHQTVEKTAPKTKRCKMAEKIVDLNYNDGSAVCGMEHTKYL